MHQAAPAQPEPRPTLRDPSEWGPKGPPTGTGAVVVGAIFMGEGVGSLFAGLIYSALAAEEEDGYGLTIGPDYESMATVYFVMAAISEAIGIPLLIIGIHKKKIRRRWYLEQQGNKLSFNLNF